MFQAYQLCFLLVNFYSDKEAKNCYKMKGIHYITCKLNFLSPLNLPRGYCFENNQNNMKNFNILLIEKSMPMHRILNQNSLFMLKEKPCMVHP